MYKRLLLFLLVGLPFVTIAQELSEGQRSIAESYLDSAKYLMGTNLARVKTLLDKGRNVYAVNTEDSLRCAFTEQEIEVNIYRGDFDDATRSLELLREDSCIEKYLNFKLIFHIHKAYLYRVRSQYRKAIVEYEQVLSMIKGGEHDRELIKTYHGLGSSYHRLEEIENSLACFKKAKRLVRENTSIDSLTISNLYKSSGALYQEYGLWDEGLKDINIAENMQPNNSRTKIYVFKNKALMYTRLDSFDKAEFFYYRMMEASKENHFMIADAKAGLAKLYLKNIGFNDKVEGLLKEAYSEFLRSGNSKTQSQIAYNLAIEYLKLNDLKEAKMWVRTHNEKTKLLNISKYEIKNNYLNLKLQQLETGNPSQEIDKIALYADSIQLVLDNEKLRKNEIGNKIKENLDHLAKDEGQYQNKFLIGSTMLLIFGSIYLFISKWSRSKIDIRSNRINTAPATSDGLIQKLSTEKHYLEAQNKKLIFQKGELESLNQKLEADITVIKQRQNITNDKLEIKTKSKLNYVLIRDLLYIHAEENGCRYFLKDYSSLWNDGKLKVWEEKLDPSRFVRIHRSTLVQKEYIAKIGYDKLSLVDGTELKIGRKYKENL